MKKQWKWAIGTAAFCIIAPIAETAVVQVTRFHVRDEGALAASRFLDALALHDYEKAHTVLTLAQQQMITAATIQKAEEQAERKYGRPTRKAAVDEYSVDSNLGGGTFPYDNAYQSQEELVLVTVTRTDRGWRVVKYQYDYNPA